MASGRAKTAVFCYTEKIFMVPTETPTGNAQLDGLLSLMRQPVPEAQAERTKVFGAVRKSIGELQANLNALTQPQVKQLQVAIADYEARTKTVQAEIHDDLGTLRQQILKTHPAAATAPAATINAINTPAPCRISL
jgi:uncharacterized protein YlxW (UPF0749 family)